MQEIIFLRFGPTSKIIGNIYNPWWFNENGFNVHFWDLSNIFYNKKKLSKFYSISKDFKFKGPRHKVFFKKSEVIKLIKNFSSETICFYFNRDPFINYSDDEWLYLNILKYTKKIFPLEFENIPPNINIFKKIKFNFDLYKLRYKSQKFKIHSFIGCGKLGRKYSKKVYPYAKFLSVPCPLVNWTRLPKIEKKNYNVFVDENVIFYPDSVLFNTKFNIDPKGYYKRINIMLDKIEKWSKKPTIIAASGKYYYKENPYKGRKLIYHKTHNLIQHSSLVLGHGSSAIYQAIVDQKPIIHIDDDSFTKELRSGTIHFCANITGRKVIFAKNMSQEYFNKENKVNKKNNQIINYYFKEETVKKNYYETVKKYLIKDQN